jgi:hypothetical protein
MKPIERVIRTVVKLPCMMFFQFHDYCFCCEERIVGITFTWFAWCLFMRFVGLRALTIRTVLSLLKVVIVQLYKIYERNCRTWVVYTQYTKHSQFLKVMDMGHILTFLTKHQFCVHAEYSIPLLNCVYVKFVCYVLFCLHAKSLKTSSIPKAKYNQDTHNMCTEIVRSLNDKHF